MNREKQASIFGKVIHGDHYGKILGFPTANIDRRQFAREKMKIKLGIWAGFARLKIENYSAAIVVGPLDASGFPKIEAHLIGFKGNLYGKHLELQLTKFIRPFKKFKNIEDLKKQIKEDLKKVI